MTDHSTARALLEKAAAQFRYYEECHRNKVTHSVTTEADRVAIEKAEVNAALAQEIEDFIEQSLTPPEGDTVSEGDEAYEIGKRDGYDKAIQDLDLLTGGDGEYCYVIGAAHDRHCPDAETMKRRIAARFAALQSRVSPQAVEAETYRQMHEDAKELGYPSILEALEDLERLKSSPQAGMREALDAICAETGDRGDGFIDWQRCVDRIQQRASAALSTAPIPMSEDAAAEALFDEAQNMEAEQAEGFVRRFWNEATDEERDGFRRLTRAVIAALSASRMSEDAK